MKNEIITGGTLLLLLLLSGCASQHGMWVQQTSTDISTEEISQSSEIATELEETTHAVRLETLPSAKPAATDPTVQAQPTTFVQTITADDVYEIFCRELYEFHTEFTISGKITGEMLDEAYYRVYREDPELFWVCGYSAEYNSVRADIKISTLNDADASVLQQMTQTLDSVADSVAAAAMIYPDDYSRLLYVHDYIVEHTVYDDDGAEANQTNAGLHNWSTAYGCLVEGKAVCIGYAEAFQLLAQKMDIPCGICTGIADGVSHAWNYVYIDGAYYWVDVTWDDPTTEGNTYLHHTYFMINDEQLYRTRTLDQDNGMVPVCDSLENNYYVRNTAYLTDYSFAEIDRRMSAADQGIEVMFSEYALYEQAMRELFTEGMIWNTAVYSGMGGSYRCYNDDDMYVLRLEFETS